MKEAEMSAIMKLMASIDRRKWLEMYGINENEIGEEKRK
jgi:hypothetical protein